MLNFFWIFAAAIWVFAAGRVIPERGLCVALALLVALPATARIDFGGSLPELTVHRVILLLVTLRWLGSNAGRFAKPPFLSLLILMAVTRALSTVLSTTPAASIKDLLGFLMEVVLFYYVVFTTIASKPSATVSAITALVGGLTSLAAAVFVERFTGFSIIHLAFPWLPSDDYGAQATYRHRILFGYAMAMGVPLAMYLLDEVQTRRHRQLLWAAICLMASSCYFSTSRGPWLGLLIAVGIIGLIGGTNHRKRCTWIAILGIATMLIRPGVWETIASKYFATVDSTTHKGSSYQYRYKLWHVAWAEIVKSPERTLFGYGGLSTETMDLGHYFEAQAGGTIAKLGYTSWDNRYACDIIEFGLIGFGLVVVLFTGVLVKLFRTWWIAEGEERPFLAAMLAAMAVFVFAQSNVDIFSVQLKLLFWAVTAIGFGAALSAVRPKESALEHSNGGMSFLGPITHGVRE